MIYEKLFGDKGYISQTLFKKLFIDGIHLITKVRKNMRNSLMQMSDKLLFRTRTLVETIFQIKVTCNLSKSLLPDQVATLVHL